MRRESFLIAILVALGPVISYADDYTALMAQGRAALQAKDYEGAQAALEKAVTTRPSEPGAHYALGRAYAGQKKYQFATKHLKETLRLSPGHIGALVDLADIEAASGQFDEASGHYREALRQGAAPDARRGLAQVMAKQGRIEEAIAELRALLTTTPGDTTAHYRLGVLLMQRGDCDQAVDQFREVTHLDSQHQGAWYNLGNCLNRLGRQKDAAEANDRFRKTTQNQDRQVDHERRGYFILIEVDRLMQQGDLHGALRKIEEGVRINPDDAKIHAMHGQCLDALGHDTGALAAYRKSAALNPLDPIVMVETGRLLAKTRRMEEAITFLQDAARLDPLMPEPHRFLAAIYNGLGRATEAAREQSTYRRLAADRDRRPR